MNRYLKTSLKRLLSPAVIRRLVRIHTRIAAWVYRDDLSRLAAVFGTDKWNCHWYMQHYQKHFGPIRNKKLNILEIGVGGYQERTEGAGSLRTWKTYFRKSMIYGIDIYDKSNLQEYRIRIFQGDQSHADFLRRVVREAGGLDIIIDDGSHINTHVLKSFEVLFPLLNDNGIYVVEDTQTSYWPGFGGSSKNFDDRNTTMGYFKSLVDGLNHKEFIWPGYAPTYFDLNIVAMSFYHNLVFIFKGVNSEESNFIRDNVSTLDCIVNSQAQVSSDGMLRRIEQNSAT